MKYRAEIDGLRAIAVIPVILFHAGFEYFKGGYIGVDVFFVISGYLITTIIIAEKENGVFSLINFYERRARRILPALFFVMFISLFFSWFYLPPTDMESFSKSMIAVSSFTSNIFFWRESGYWGIENELKPLLHTWSLSVEEQYYIIFPLLLILIWKLNKFWIASIFIIIILSSLLLSQWGAYNSPTANFFLLPTRAWEIAIGALIALYIFYWEKPSGKLFNELFGIIGLFMIGYSIFIFDEKVPFPSFYSLVPTIGAGLIILFSSKESLAGKFLGQKFFVGIGLISYSAYLFHQPVIAFVRHASFIQPSRIILIIAIILSFFLAYFSWKFVEKPFRNKNKFDRKSIFIYSLVISLFFVGVGTMGLITEGFKDRFTISQQLTEKKTIVNHGLSDICDGVFTLSPDCRTSNKPEILIWGDSFAMHLVQGIISSNPEAKIIQMTKSSCGPFFNISKLQIPKYSLKWANSCLKFTEKVRDWIKENDTIKYVVISSPFYSYISGKEQLLSSRGDLSPNNIKLAAKEFEKTLNELISLGIKPIIFSPPPANGIDLGRCLTKAVFSNHNLDECNFKESKIIQDRLEAYEFLRLFENKYKVVKLEKMICHDLICKTHVKSTFIFRDGGHLSKEGSALLGKKFNFYEIITESKIF